MTAPHHNGYYFLSFLSSYKKRQFDFKLNFTTRMNNNSSSPHAESPSLKKWKINQNNKIPTYRWYELEQVA